MLHQNQEVNMRVGQNNNNDESYYLNQVLNYFRKHPIIRIKPGRPIIIELEESPILTSRRSESHSRMISPSQISSSMPSKRRRRTARKRVRKRRIRRHFDRIKAYQMLYEKKRENSLGVKGNNIRESHSGTTDTKVISSKGRMVNIVGLRKFALERLPSSSTLRDILMVESKELTVEEFLAKMDIWILLFKKDVGG